jgi:hypothetical protein
VNKPTGYLILAACVVGLGLWAQTFDAPRVQDRIRDAAQTVMVQSVHGAIAEVSGRDIKLTGTIDGPDELASLLAGLDAVAGRRVITQDVTVLEKV